MAFRLVGDGWFVDKGSKKANVGDCVVKLWKNYVRQARATDSKPLAVVSKIEPGRCFVHWIQQCEKWEVVTKDGVIPLRTI